ncbi:glycosyltransferase family 2 protein [Pseudarthrobacter sp. N5]|uniref:glycosyltransferase family 2 protein n=1 Tax=Pseudarthrobacter sp. N5 TaxID=3418416 RepID=UPI003CF12E45
MNKLKISSIATLGMNVPRICSREWADSVIAVVVAYKSWTDLAECCARLRKIPAIEQLVVVDNSYSEVGSCLEHSNIHPVDRWITHAIPPSNLGYAGGNNFGFEVARTLGANEVLVCNPDVQIYSDVIEGLIAEMQTEALDLISPYMREVDLTGEVRNLKNPGWDQLLGKGVVEIPATLVKSRYIPTFYGACFIVTMRLIDDLGGLSEDFFLYGEEIDFKLRMERSAYRWAVSSDFGVTHDRGSSISPGEGGKSLVAFFQSARSAVIVGRKYWPQTVAFWTFARSVLAVALVFRGRPSEARAVVRGAIQGWKARVTI